jgi:hypothetical protein
MIQIDPISATIAAVALVVAVVSLIKAERAPAKARAATFRDEIRFHLISVSRQLEAAGTAMSNGNDLPEAKLFESFNKVNEIAPRVADNGYSYESLGAILMLADAKWWGVVRAQKDLSWRVRELAEHREPNRDGLPSKADLEEAKARAERRLSAMIAELREPLQTAKNRIDLELNRLNRLDRGERA